VPDPDKPGKFKIKRILVVCRTPRPTSNLRIRPILPSEHENSGGDFALASCLKIFVDYNFSPGFFPDSTGVIYYIKLRAKVDQDNHPGNIIGGKWPWTSTFTHQFYNKKAFDCLFAYGTYACTRALMQYQPELHSQEKMTEIVKDLKKSLIKPFSDNFEIKKESELKLRLLTEIKKATDNDTDDAPGKNQTVTQSLFEDTVEEALIALRERDYATTLMFIEKALRISRSPLGYLVKGDALFGLNKFELAREAYMAGIFLSPHDAVLEDRVEKVTVKLYGLMTTNKKKN